VYDLAVVRDVICDIVNTFARPAFQQCDQRLRVGILHAARASSNRTQIHPFTPLRTSRRDIAMIYSRNGPML
jgi:hypothetical protein